MTILASEGVLLVFARRFVLCGHVVLAFDAASLDHGRVVRGGPCSVSVLFNDVIPGEGGEIDLLEAVLVWILIGDLIDGLIEACNCGQGYTFLDLLVLLMTIAKELGLRVLRLEFVVRTELLGKSLDLTA